MLEGMVQQRIIPDVPGATPPGPARSHSLFRYPGGKTWLAPWVRRWLTSMPDRPALFVEPFLGGGVISLTVAMEGLAARVVMSEIDEEVAAVWQTVLGPYARWLSARIGGFRVTEAAVREVLAAEPTSVRARAFRAIVRNRMNRGGIMAHGAGLLRSGEAGRGLLSRWYPETLQRRIEAIEEVADRLDFLHGDGLGLIKHASDMPGAALFIDPPYTASHKSAGDRLYAHSEVDHARVFALASRARGPLLMTYYDDPEVRRLAVRSGLSLMGVAMRNTHHVEMRELLISDDLSWAR